MIFVDSTFGFKTCVFDGLTGSNDCILRVEVELTLLFAVEVLVGIEILHFASKLSLELGCVKVGNRTGAAFSVLGIVPGGGDIIAKGRKGSETGYDNSF